MHDDGLSDKLHDVGAPRIYILTVTVNVSKRNKHIHAYVLLMHAFMEEDVHVGM
jgi:hypothetical protein